MQRKIILLLLSFCPILAFAQSNISADSANNIIMNGGSCTDRTYTRVEKIPSLKISKQEFIDSVSIYLKSKRRSYGNGTIKFSFVVDCHSDIINLQKMSGNILDLSSLTTAIQKCSNFWLPARQNNYIVSAFVTMEMYFKNNTLDDITISQ